MLRAVGLAVLALLGGACTGKAPTAEVAGRAEQGLAATERLRVVAANLSSGNGQSYDPGEGVRILSGLHPDVVLVQEMNVGGGTDAELDAFAAEVVGAGAFWAREPAVQIPNGIVSRYPIVVSGNWRDPFVSNRSFAWARIDVPGPDDLLAVSVHLLTTGSAQRDAEARAVLAQVTANAPPGGYVVLGGDLNTGSRGEACVHTLGRGFVTAGPYPADRNGNETTNASRKKAYDWVLASPSLDAQKVTTVVGASAFPGGLVADTRVYAPLAEIAPARASDSAARGMQHMAVVRDFELPVP